MGGHLDLAALITIFDGRQHATQPVDLAKLVEDAILDGAFDDFNAGRSTQRVHQELEQARALAATWAPCKTKPECDARVSH